MAPILLRNAPQHNAPMLRTDATAQRTSIWPPSDTASITPFDRDSSCGSSAAVAPEHQAHEDGLPMLDGRDPKVLEGRDLEVRLATACNQHARLLHCQLPMLTTYFGSRLSTPAVTTAGVCMTAEARQKPSGRGQQSWRTPSLSTASRACRNRMLEWKTAA